MKALTLHQPWASLVALGVKTIETRSWPCPPSLIGQPLAIHAGLDVGFCTIGAYSIDRDVDNVWCLVDPERVWTSLPLGAVVATCRVAACVPIVAERGCTEVKAPEAGMITVSGPHSPVHCVTRFTWLNTYYGPGLYIDKELTEAMRPQLPYGDFSPGRYAWLLGDVKPTTVRCPWCWGHQGRHADICSAAGVNDPCHICGDGAPCSTCGGAGHCPPVPARGRQRVWNWEP